jgi:hypothetical protein
MFAKSRNINLLILKKYILLLVVLFLTSCSSDDLNSTDSGMVGNWKLTSLTVDNAILINGISTTNLTNMATNSQITFTNRSSGRMDYVTGLAFFTQTINQNIEYSSASAMENWTFKFVTDNNIVVLKKDNNETVSLTLNQNTLTLELENGIVAGNLDTNTNQYFTTKYIFTKQ